MFCIYVFLLGGICVNTSLGSCEPTQVYQTTITEKYAADYKYNSDTRQTTCSYFVAFTPVDPYYGIEKYRLSTGSYEKNMDLYDKIEAGDPVTITFYQGFFGGYDYKVVLK